MLHPVLDHVVFCGNSKMAVGRHVWRPLSLVTVVWYSAQQFPWKEERLEAQLRTDWLWPVVWLDVWGMEET